MWTGPSGLEQSKQESRPGVSCGDLQRAIPVPMPYSPLSSKPAMSNKVAVS